MNRELKTHSLISLQNGFKAHLDKVVSNNRSKETYAFASRHFLLFCEDLDCTEISRVPEMLEHWYESLTKGVITYKKHVRNHFIPYLEYVCKREIEETLSDCEPPKKKRRIHEPLRINISLCQRIVAKKRKLTLREKVAMRMAKKKAQEEDQHHIQEEDQEEEYEEHHDSPSKFSILSLLFVMYAIVSM